MRGLRLSRPLFLSLIERPRLMPSSPLHPSFHTTSSLRLATDSLHLTHLSHIILDATHLDAKKRSLVDMPEAREDLFKLVLGNKDIVERLKEGKCKIVVY